MPTYEYECKSCSHVFEVFQSMTAKLLNKCPKCRKSIRRLFGIGAGIIFKGSGFYETDYKRKALPQTACKSDAVKNVEAKEKVSATSSKSSDRACAAAAGTCREK